MEEEKKVRGIKIRTFNTCMIILCCIVYLFLIFATASMPSKYNALVQDTDQYINCQRDAELVYQASFCGQYYHLRGYYEADCKTAQHPYQAY